MDETVRQALIKWPNVPACTGWLLLDRRGNWRMRDEATQASGTAGEPIRHRALLSFINRNYACDEHGQWFFQNGPQRVYVELAYAPWSVRLATDAQGTLTLTDQAGNAFEPDIGLIDEEGSVLFADNATPPRLALLHDHDLELFAEHATLDETGHSGVFRWRPAPVLPLLLEATTRDALPARFGFVMSPASRVG
ncbi:DUF2946 family protein [Paraburkholderia bonniea]|uniref:DUF2946 family protein n=1 Tax=Paraburkholderia bonniea TaxID=2152891 RepID=UPI0012924FE9|nr:DUF2946 family protein [Paraburkholderia bonniea]WJF89731.1 DUF2946 family protein [Paraburkholderia bonniea]WJF93045.1 DUF2946 family protein [Paraburkholderia bonniea]